MSFAPALVLRAGDRDRLADLARLPSVPSRLAKRARMVLLAADGCLSACNVMLRLPTSGNDRHRPWRPEFASRGSVDDLWSAPACCAISCPPWRGGGDGHSGAFGRWRERC